MLAADFLEANYDQVIFNFIVMSILYHLIPGYQVIWTGNWNLLKVVWLNRPWLGEVLILIFLNLPLKGIGMLCWNRLK
jgi:hypothetical protein